jgi:DinB superfamily
MAPTTNYSKDLGDREPLAAMRDSIARLTALTHGWSAADFERRYAPGKWTALQVMTHLAQTELALGVRARMALATPTYTAQAFDQDAWISRETRLSGAEAVAAFAAVGAMNVALFASLSAADRETAMAHPEYGSVTVDWIIHTLAGHQIHHLNQLLLLSIPNS